jgi:phosphoribosyl 1,2-cyclic phosphodiesterase
MVVLGSGSSGNAIVATDGDTTVLVDCGFSALEVSKRLRAASIDPASVSAILITHEHGDHVRGVDVFCRRHAPSCAVVATSATLGASGLRYSIERCTAVAPGETLQLGTLSVLPFCTSHDAVDPVGYRIESRGRAIGIVTDTGVLTAEAREALAGCQLLGIESNHDLRMLETGPYPAYLKRRIRSADGHLSNEDAADALESLAHDGLEQVFALHRSRTNNTAELAGAPLTERLARLGLRVPVTVAAQHASCDSHPPQGALFESA